MIRTDHIYHVCGFSFNNHGAANVSVETPFNTVHLFPSGMRLKDMVESNLEGKENEPLMLSSSKEFRPVMIACKNTLAILSIPYDKADEFRERIRLYHVDRLIFKEGDNAQVMTVGLTKETNQPVLLPQVVQLSFWDSAIEDRYTAQLNYCLENLDIKKGEAY